MGTIFHCILDSKLFPLILSGGSFSSHRSFPCMHMLFRTWMNIQETCCRSLEFSFYAALTSLVLCTANSWPSHITRFMSSTQRDCQAPHIFSLPVIRPGNSLQTVSWGNHKAHLMYFPYLRDHCPLLPNI